jgi:ribosomal protein L11 methyltransferase
MGHYEFKLKTPPESREALINMLDEAGCLGVIEEAESLLAYFPDHLEIDRLAADISAFSISLKGAGLPSSFAFMHVHLPDCDWNETWKKNIQPIEAGERLTIIPPWDGPRAGRLNIVIDPGMAFGTGHHETTKTCLGLIEKLAGKVHKGRFLDVGAGTGILAICAAKLGFMEVCAVDTDPLAIEAALRNISLNKLNHGLIVEYTIRDAQGDYDMIAANLISETLIAIAPEIACRLRENGIAILSGMLTGQEDEIVSAMQQEGLKFSEKYIDSERWVTLVFKR